MTGMNKYDDKRKRAMRMRNHIARDLASGKYHQRIKEGRPKPPPPEIDEDDDEDWYNTGIIY